MKYYWINIDNSTERRDFMEKQFKDLGLENDNIRISAVTPNDFKDVLVEKEPLTCGWKGCKTCSYEYACLCSHIKAMIKGVEDGNDYFCILEDDMKIPYKINFENIIKKTPSDFEILQMMILYGNTVFQFYGLYRNKNIFCLEWQYLLPSTGMYIISKEGAIKLINEFYDKKTNKYCFESSKYQKVADVLLYSSVKTYATTVPYCYPHIPLGSEIHPDHIDAHSNAARAIITVLNDMKTHKDNNDTFYNLV